MFALARYLGFSNSNQSQRLQLRRGNLSAFVGSEERPFVRRELEHVRQADWHVRRRVQFSQCARKLYFITAGRIIESFFVDFLFVIFDGSLWAASARVGSHTGQTIGNFVEGKPALLFDIPE